MKKDKVTPTKVKVRSDTDFFPIALDDKKAIAKVGDRTITAPSIEQRDGKTFKFKCWNLKGETLEGVYEEF